MTLIDKESGMRGQGNSDGVTANDEDGSYGLEVTARSTDTSLARYMLQLHISRSDLALLKKA